MTELPPNPDDRPALRRFSRRPEQPAPPPQQPAPQYPAPPPPNTPPSSWPEPAPAGRPRRGMLLAPLVAAIAVALVAGGIVLLRHSGADAGSPPQLALVDAAVPAESQADAAAAAGTAPMPALGGGYTVEGSLPTGPAKAAVRTLPAGQATAAAVEKLARALGLTTTPKRVGGAWTVDDGDRSLRVIDGGGWQWLYDNARRSTGGGMACDVIVNGRRLCLPGRPLPGGGTGKVTPIDPPAANPGDEDGSGSSGPGGGSNGSSGSGTAGAPDSSTGSYPGGGSADGSTGSGGTADQPGTDPTTVPGAPAAGSGGGTAAGQVEPATPSPGGTVVAVPAPGGLPLPVEPTGPTPDEAAVRSAATSVLTALGLGNAEIRVQTFPAIAIVTAAPVVAGLPTAGFEVRLQYNAKIELAGGSGWLATPVTGTEYPLVSAQKALDALPNPEIARVCTDRMPATCAIPQRVITGARLGLALRHDQQAGPLLVPAWLYTIKGSDLPLTAIAVDPKYISPGDKKNPPPADLPTSGPGRPIPLPPQPTK
ncbi:MAG TPA: hypothetical protein VMU51_26720 [Mycobacteriales bacterium]|nr:hypothetical protein [Mycobacteriales bacterium]